MNKNFVKIGILANLLIIPILVYMFLQFFGKNHYRIRKYYPLEVFSYEKDGKLVNDTSFHTIPYFPLIDSNNDSLSKSRLENDVLIVSFFFTRCPSICPIITSNLTLAQEAFYQKEGIKILSITVDADYDKGDILKKYQKRFNINDKKWILSTGNPMDIYNLGFYGFKLPSDTVDKTLHSEKVVLLDKKRQIRGYYTGTDKKEIERLITEANILLYNYANGEE